MTGSGRVPEHYTITEFQPGAGTGVHRREGQLSGDGCYGDPRTLELVLGVTPRGEPSGCIRTDRALQVTAARREWLARSAGFALWGTDTRVLYDSAPA